jgi:NitT/TauT family transport system substrate-binding protein
MTKLHLPRRAILAAVPALLAAPAIVRAQGSKPEKSKIALAVGGKSALYYLSLTIAEKKGFFKDAGLDVEISDFAGGTKSLESLIGGSVDVVAGAYEHTIRMQQRGQAIKGFALIGRGMQIAIAMRNDVADKVKTGADIKGMKMGISAPGSSTHMLLMTWAAKGGLKATDFSVVGLGAGAPVVAAIEQKLVDGISQTDPAVRVLQDKNEVKVVLDTRTMKGNQEFFGGAFPAACLYAQPGLLTKMPNTSLALATAIVRADEWLQTAKPSEVADTVPPAYLLGDRSAYEKSFEGMRDCISPDGIMPAGAQDNCMKFLLAGDPKLEADKGKIKLEDTWTNEFAAKAKKHS